MIRRFGPVLLLLQLALDILLTLAAVKGAEQLRLHVVTGLERRADTPQAYAIGPEVYGLIVVIWACFFLVFGALSSRRRESLLVDLGKLWVSVTVAMLILASTFYLLGLEPPTAPSRLFYLYFYVLDLFLLVAAHVVVDLLLSHMRRRGHDLRRVLLVGMGLQPRLLAVRLRDREAAGLQLLGYLSPPDEPPLDGLQRFGEFSRLRSVVEREGVDEVVMALPASAHEETLRLDAELRDLDVNVRILPDVFELVAMRAEAEDFYGLPLISLREPSMNPAQIMIKRAFDLVVAGVLFLLCLPVYLLIALWVRFDSPGPILIHQRRVGAGGRIFYMHKFRSMRWNPEDLDADKGKVRNDPRVTRAGRFLRRSSFDELPQLWNVIRGDMSLVGPRPELPVIVEQYEPWQRKRFNVPPGMTGWWQVTGRGDQSMHLNTEIDLFYVQNYSILLDLQILLHTLGAVIRGKGAF